LVELGGKIMAKVIEVKETGNIRKFTVEGIDGKTRAFEWSTDTEMTAKAQAREAVLLVESAEAREAVAPAKVYSDAELAALNEVKA
jgi:hypothetical protein